MNHVCWAYVNVLLSYYDVPSLFDYKARVIVPLYFVVVGVDHLRQVSL